MPHRLEALKKDFAKLETDFQAMADSIPQLAWMADGEGAIFWFNQRWFDFTGTTLEQMQGWGWKNAHHPDHVDRVVSSLKQACATGLPWEDLFPLRSKNGSYRWFLSQAQPARNAAGKVVRWFGTNTDITEQKMTEERQTLLMREIDHRARNALAVAQAIVNLTEADTVEAYKAAVQGRIDALTRTHSQLAASRWDGADLKAIVAEEIQPFAPTGSSRISMSGKSVRLKPAQAQTLGLILHELATNASRYGALSHADGSLKVSWRESDDRVTLNWRELGGQNVMEPGRKGFGTGLLERLINDFEGQLTRNWHSDGLAVSITMRTQEGAPKADVEPVVRAVSADPGSARKRILIVEDEPMTALDLEMRLIDAGYDVLGPAATLQGAEHELDLCQPDIALLDSNLGGTKSYPLAERLQAAGVPVIFCTGYEELDDLPDSLKACPIVSKPFKEAILMQKLSSGLASAAA
jgi:PAS domain S-box-containing protein